jgi:hypothetical protein
LFIGVNILLKGVEISNCDTLVIEGNVEATINSKTMKSPNRERSRERRLSMSPKSTAISRRAYRARKACRARYGRVSARSLRQAYWRKAES